MPYVLVGVAVKHGNDVVLHEFNTPEAAHEAAEFLISHEIKVAIINDAKNPITGHRPPGLAW